MTETLIFFEIIILALNTYSTEFFISQSTPSCAIIFLLMSSVSNLSDEFSRKTAVVLGRVSMEGAGLDQPNVLRKIADQNISKIDTDKI